MPEPMSCQRVEPLLGDYLEAKLAAVERGEVESHLASCQPCGEMAADIGMALGFLRQAEPVPVPPDLMARILERTSGRESRGWRLWVATTLKPWFAPVLEPRMAMGMMMGAISLSLALNAMGLDFRNVRAADLRPSEMVWNVKRYSSLALSKVESYYMNLKVVYEVQSELRALRDEDPTDQKKKDESEAPETENSAPEKPQPKAPQKTDKLNRDVMRPTPVFAVYARPAKEKLV